MMSPHISPTPNARARILIAAAEMFATEGVHGTGINAVIARSGVAKDTLYKHFTSKDELVVEVLRLQDECWRDGLRGHVERTAGSPKQKLLSVFDFLDAELGQEAYRGSAFLASSTDYPDPGHPVRRTCAAHKDRLRAYLAGLADDASIADSDTLGRQLMLLIDGAICARTLQHDLTAGRRAKQAAAVLVEAAAR